MDDALEPLHNPKISSEFLDAIDAFIGFIELEQGLSSNTSENYSSDLTQFATFLSKNKVNKWPDVEYGDLTLWLSELTHEGYKVTSLARKLSAIRMFAKYLVQEKRCTNNFTLLIDGPRRVRKLPIVLSIQEMDRLLDTPNKTTTTGVRDWAILELMYSSGLRVSELCQLTLQSINADEGFIRVFGKGAKERIIPVGKTALQALMNYLVSSRPKLVKAKTSSQLFISQLGTAISRKTIWVLLKKYAKDAGIQKNIKPHTLRHSFATHILANGGDLRAIQEMLGHADISTTEIYTAVEPQHILDTHEAHHPRNKQTIG